MAEYRKARAQSLNDETFEGDKVAGGVRGMVERYPGGLTAWLTLSLGGVGRGPAARPPLGSGS